MLHDRLENLIQIGGALNVIVLSVLTAPVAMLRDILSTWSETQIAR